MISFSFLLVFFWPLFLADVWSRFNLFSVEVRLNGIAVATVSLYLPVADTDLLFQTLCYLLRRPPCNKTHGFTPISLLLSSRVVSCEHERRDTHTLDHTHTHTSKQAYGYYSPNVLTNIPHTERLRPKINSESDRTVSEFMCVGSCVCVWVGVRAGAGFHGMRAHIWYAHDCLDKSAKISTFFFFL